MSHLRTDIGSNELAVTQSSTGKEVNTEAEESILLGDVTYKRVVKTSWQNLLCAVVRSRMHELATVL
jgi:hypothetical protein